MNNRKYIINLDNNYTIRKYYNSDTDNVGICSICNNNKNNTQYNFQEMYYGSGEIFPYMQCSKCGCLQLMEKPKEMANYYPSNYYSYNFKKYKFNLNSNPIVKKFSSIRNNYAISNTGILGKILYILYPLDELKSLVTMHFPFKNRYFLKNKDIRILDVGCGSGDFLWVLNYFGFKNTIGIDPYIKKDILYSSGLKIHKKTIYELDQKYDLIMFHHSFEHLDRPLQILQHVWRLLSNVGICVIRMPVVNSYLWQKYKDRWVGIDPPRHFFIHSLKSIKILANEAYFSLKQIIYDSTEFNFWASEQYLKDIPLMSDKSYFINKSKSIFHDKQIDYFKKLAEDLNRKKQGDQAAFYLEKRDGKK